MYKRIAVVLVFLVVTAGMALNLPALKTAFTGLGGKKEPIAIGFVDVQKVFERSELGKTKIAEFQSELDERKAEVEKLNNQVESLQQQIRQLAAKGNRAAAERKIPQLQAAQKKLMETQQQAAQTLQQAQSEVDKTFMEQLKTVVDQVRREEHLDIIESYDPKRVLSFETSRDVTEKVLIKYNQRFPADIQKAAKKSTAK